MSGVIAIENNHDQDMEENQHSAVYTLMSIAEKFTGIQLGSHKLAMVRARLGKRLRRLKIDFKDYAKLIEQDQGEFRTFIDLITTNHTHWWREPDHFEHLRSQVLAPMRAAGANRLRIWCAGAASGEEPYSIAHTVISEFGIKPTIDVAILATDISSRALAHARQGIYHKSKIDGLPAHEQSAALEPIKSDHDFFTVKNELRALINFARLNLLGEWPMQGPFDIIFCRNVMIYFSKETQQQLLDRFNKLLKSGGLLYLGHSESLTRINHSMRSVGASIYRKL